MNFLLAHKTILRTSLSKEEVIKHLSGFISHEELFAFGLLAKGERNSKKSYEGNINENKFTIQRISREERKSYTPLICGMIQDDFNGTLIHIKIKPDKFFYVFLILFIALLAYNESLFFPVAIETKNALFALMPLGMLLFAYSIILYKFNRESRKAKADLMMLLNAVPYLKL
ncbi:MAG: hypothetical protein JWO09_3511 [Bacteroidetes bacterium]|nr:hypothetical protein [Bacteroidota bacterium]